MANCQECGEYVPVKTAVEAGLISAHDVSKARNDIRGCNGYCRAEGLINTTRKEDDGCAAFACSGHA
ncbi:MAG: hypothetical protein HY985_07095 [Magnetospirillum sp.]|nr:hypothetical protein [Magnetospirillum sp.]